VLIVIAAVLAAAEGATRILDCRLPEPLTWHSYDTQKKVQQMDALAKRGGVDIAFFGTSMMNVGVDPALVMDALGGSATAYNASLNSAIPRLTEVWARDVVFPRLHPEVVVIGVASYDLSDTGANRTTFLDAFLDSASGKRAAGEDGVLDKANYWMAQHFELWDYRAELRDPDTLLDALRGKKPVKDKEAVATDALGHSTAVEAQQFVNRSGLPVEQYKVGTADADALRRLISYAEKQGSRVVLVDMPVTQEFVDRHPDGDATYADFVDRLQALADDMDVPLLRFDSIRDHLLFADQVHLNRSGTEMFTTQLTEALANAGVLGGG